MPKMHLLIRCVDVALVDVSKCLELVLRRFVGDRQAIEHSESMSQLMDGIQKRLGSTLPSIRAWGMVQRLFG